MLSAHRLAELCRVDPGLALIAAAALILALDPVLWLVATWRDPAYDSNGFLVFLATAALLAWSATSPVVAEDRPRQSLALALILISAAVRLAGQVLAINTVGALCLVLDVYALGLLLRLSARARPISQAWLRIVRSLLSAQGGSICFAPGDNGGATFVLTLPKRPVHRPSSAGSVSV